MLRIIFVGFWIVCVTLGATYGGAYWRSHAKSGTDDAHEMKLAVRPLKVLTVPIIDNGVLRGYVSATFSIVAPAPDPHNGGLDPESFILDEAFRMIYSTKILISQISGNMTYRNSRIDSPKKSMRVSVRLR